MKCQICNENLGEFQCSKCGRIVCKEHSKNINGTIYCTDHIPKQDQGDTKEDTKEQAPQENKKKSDTLGAIRTLILTLLALLLGLGFIYYIFQSSIIELFGTEGFLGLAGSIQSSINLMFLGLGGLALVRKQKK